MAEEADIADYYGILLEDIRAEFRIFIEQLKNIRLKIDNCPVEVNRNAHEESIDVEMEIGPHGE